MREHWGAQRGWDSLGTQAWEEGDWRGFMISILSLW